MDIAQSSLHDTKKSMQGSWGILLIAKASPWNKIKTAMLDDAS